MDPQILDIETKLAYQEDIIEQLNQVVIEQQKTIDVLSTKLDSVVEFLKNSDSSDIRDSGIAETPPHY
jgi:uncharacterized coiled-coil protein SlyX